MTQPGRLRGDRHRDLVRTWTAKEAVAKAYGCSPDLALADVEVDRDTARVPERIDGTGVTTWDLHDLPIAPTHVTTLATTPVARPHPGSHLPIQVGADP